MRANTRRATAIAALTVAALSWGALQSVAAAQQTPDLASGSSYQTGPPITYPATTPPPQPPKTTPPGVTTAPATTPPKTTPPATTVPATPPPATATPPVTISPGGNGLPVTGVRSVTFAGAGLVLIAVGLLAWVLAGRRRIRT